jgi:hypothetical protein
LLTFLLTILGVSNGQTFLTSLNGTKYSHTFTITAGPSNAAVATFYLIGAGGGAAGNNGNKGGGGGASGGYVRGTYTVPAGQSRKFLITLGVGGVGRSANSALAGEQGGNTQLQLINPLTNLPDNSLNVTVIGGNGGSLNSTISNTGRSNVTTGLSVTTPSGTNNSNNIGNIGSWSNGASGSGGGSVNLTGESAFTSGNSSSFAGGTGGGTGGAGSNGGFGTGGGSAGKANSTDLAGGNGGDGFVRIDLAGNGATLPVTFGAIKASEKGTGVQIDWTSYSELNISNY